MKTRIYTAIIFALLVLPAAVFANAEITYRYFRQSDSVPLNSVQAVGYTCLDPGCTTVTTSPFSINANSGSATSQKVIFPTTLATYGYAMYYFRTGYLPMEYTADWYGTGSANFDIYFPKLANAFSAISGFGVSGDGINGHAVTITGTAHSAFSDAKTPPNYLITSYLDEFYSTKVKVTFRVRDSSNAVVFENSQEVNLLMDTMTTLSRSWTPTSDGTYTLYFITEVTDDQVSSTVQQMESATYTVRTPDTAGPVVTLQSPANGAKLTNNAVTFVYRANDVQSGIKQCSLYVDGALISTSSSVTENVDQSFSATVSDGSHSWYVRCTDDSSNSNVGTSATWTFSIDSDVAAPVVNLVSPSNGASLNSNSVTLVYNVNDVKSAIASCTLYIDGAAVETDTTVAEGVNQEFHRTVSDGSHSWYVRCTDSSANANVGTSATWTFRIDSDTSGPVVTLKSPADMAKLTSGTVTFTYQVNDIVSGIKQCSLYLDGALVATDSNVAENVDKTFTQYGVSDGSHTWYVRCTDDSSNANVGTSATWRFSIDSDVVGPEVTLVAPSNGAKLSTNSVVLKYRVNDMSSAVASCTLYLDGAAVDTRTNVQENVDQEVTRSVSDGSHSWYVRCTDSSANANVGTSATWSFSVDSDTAGPVVTLKSPADLAKLTSGTVNFVYSVNDVKNGIKECSLYLDGALVATDNNVLENVDKSFTRTGISDGSHTWYVRCTDDSSNANVGTSATWRFSIDSDTTPPQVSLVSPSNGAKLVSSSVTFRYRVDDAASAVASCTLYLDGAAVDTRTNVQENVDQEYVRTVSVGTHSWYVRCTDSSANANVGTSATWSFSVDTDTTPPVVNLYQPADGYILRSRDVRYEYRVEDLDSGIESCSLYRDGMLIQTKTNIAEGIVQSFDEVNAPLGAHTWFVRCTDSSANRNVGTSPTRSFSIELDTAAPVVSLDSPVNGATVSTSTVTYKFIVTDNVGVASCSLYRDGMLIETDTTVSTGIIQTFTEYGVSETSHTWYVRCTDTSGNIGTSATWSFNVNLDTAGPVIQLVSPYDLEDLPSSTVTFVYRVDDVRSQVSSCSLYLDGVNVETDTSIAEGVDQSFTRTNIVEGLHNWYVRCIDSSANANVGTSATWRFRIKLDGDQSGGPGVA